MTKLNSTGSCLHFSLVNFKQWSPFCNRQWEFHKSIIQIICYFSYFFLCIEQHTKQLLKKICMVTRDHKSACIRWVQNPPCKLQSHCNEVTALTELFRQLYSFAVLYNTPSESEILLSPIYRQRKSTEIESKKGKPGYIPDHCTILSIKSRLKFLHPFCVP